jgi:hypothetical protein
MQAYFTKELMATKKLTIGVMNAIKVRQLRLRFAVCLCLRCMQLQEFPPASSCLVR